MRNKSFPHYDQLALVWGKDRATGLNAETPIDVIENLEKDQNIDQGDDESDEENVPPRTTSLGEGTSKSKRKRRRSADGLISSLERMTNVLAAHMDKSNDQMTKIVESFSGVDKEKKDNHHKLNEELREIEVLTNSQRQKAAMKLVRDPDIMDYFFTLEDDGEKEIFLIELLEN
ncbi:hypothetical protein OROHE_025310 [Orobanche hederae]